MTLEEIKELHKSYQDQGCISRPAQAIKDALSIIDGYERMDKRNQKLIEELRTEIRKLKNPLSEEFVEGPERHNSGIGNRTNY